ncbi:unnamed protein product, partial [Rotaria sp. Silwood2]
RNVKCRDNFVPGSYHTMLMDRR